MKRLQRALAVGGGAVSAVALSACSFFSPVQTDVQYAPSDGIPVQSGAIEGRNILVVADEVGGPATVTGGLINMGEETVTVEFRSPTTSAGTITIKPREKKPISGVTIPALGAKEGPGTMTTIVMSTPDGDTTASVPVLPPVGAYETLAPEED